MNIGTFALGVYLVLIGLINVFKVNVDPVVLGVLALIAGAVILFDGFHRTRA